MASDTDGGKMNILFVHEVDYLRKVVFEFQTLSELLSLRGHNVYAVDYESMWEWGTKSKRVMRVSRAYPGGHVVLVRSRFVKVPVLSRVSAFLGSSPTIAAVLVRRAIDVVILYSVPTNGMQTLDLATSAGVPVVFRSIDILHRLTPRILSWPTKLMERSVYSRSDSVLTITPALTRYVVGLGAPADKVKLLPLGVDTDLFRPLPKDVGLLHQLGFTENDKVIVFVGTLPMFSGLDIFLRQFKDAHKMMPSLKLLIVGDGVQRPLLERIIGKLGLEKHALITGFIAHEMIPRLINLADVCINPFVISDTTRDIFPTKVIQYMACGKPVVSSELQGMVDMGLGADQGVLYADDSSSMSQVVTSIINQQALGGAALQHAVKIHSYNKVVDQLETELVNLVQGRKQ